MARYKRMYWLTGNSEALIEAVSRYLRTTEHPDEDIILAILGFEREAEE